MNTLLRFFLQVCLRGEGPVAAIHILRRKPCILSGSSFVSDSVSNRTLLAESLVVANKIRPLHVVLAACILLHDVVVRPARAVDREFPVGWGRCFGISSIKAFIEFLKLIFGVGAGIIGVLPACAPYLAPSESLFPRLSSLPGGHVHFAVAAVYWCFACVRALLGPF